MGEEFAEQQPNEADVEEDNGAVVDEALSEAALHNKLDAEVDAANKRVLQSQAELENFRKRMRREMELQERYAAAPLLKDLLTVIDDLQRAISAAEQSDDASGLLEGVKMVESRLQAVLQQHHCQQIKAAGAPFDPDVHEAILQQPSDQHEADSVMQVTQQGYALHDRVIRPAQVIVAKPTEETSE